MKEYIGSQEHWEDNINADYDEREKREKEQTDNRTEQRSNEENTRLQKARDAIENLKPIKNLEVEMKFKEHVEETISRIETKMICSIDIMELKPSEIYKEEITELLKIIMPDLLHDFWQRTSDACPLECSTHEEQERLFKEWVLSYLC